MARSRISKLTVFDTIGLEGGLISSAMLARISQRKAGGQAEADYSIPKGLALRDEIARYYRIATALFQDFRASAYPSTEATISFTHQLLSQVLGFSDLELCRENEGVAFEAIQGRVPIVVVPPSDDIDRVSSYISGEGRRRSAASALQDWLNQHENALWGICFNGDHLRLMRDNASLTRPAYVEVNLREIFEGENFADFATIWLLLHSTRFGAAGTPVTDCHLERWRDAGAKEGLVARDRLRDGVEAALLTLGNGFLAHRDNSSLRARLATGDLALPVFFGQLLRLIYRMIFLFVAEDRGLLHPPDANASACKLYTEGYSLAALRERAVRSAAWDRHFDRWEGLLITFQGLAHGQVKLGLPALGGLFENLIPDLEAARLPNKALMEAVFRLAWLKDDAILVPVNWRDMETEELGSVYESLLELAPLLTDQGRGFCFASGGETKGNQRKTTGSYYTPDSLVQTLLDSALDPVLDRIESESSEKSEGLLGVTVIDPACGSGHFLLAASRRIATRVARARTAGVASAADYRHALRDVVRSSIYGVDRNPMAVELTKVALWIETVEPGKPLGFLDANLLCGDSLLGVFDLEVLRAGVPDAAYKPLSGDDKDSAKYFDRRNTAERDGQGTFDFTGGRSTLPAAPPLAASLRAVRVLPEDNPAEISEKKRRLEAARSERERESWRSAADLYMAAFLLPKKDTPRDQGSGTVPSTGHIWRNLSGGQLYEPLIRAIQDIRDQVRSFHWPLEFPDVFAQGGFDVVIGNPPWERIKLQEQEFFAARDPEIALAPTASARSKLITRLGNAPLGTRGRVLFEQFEQARRTAEASSVFAREDGRFPLMGRGDVNTYALFVELSSQLIRTDGRAGMIVPSGVAFDETTRFFFISLIDSRRLISLYSFFEVRKWFPGTDDRKPFCLLTIGSTDRPPEFAFDIRAIDEIADPERTFSMTSDTIVLVNPNTRTAPVFRSRFDAELTTKVYARSQILVNEAEAGCGDPWGVRFLAMFHMSSASHFFKTRQELDTVGFDENGRAFFLGNDPQAQYLPLLEAKLLHIYDHRWTTFEDGKERPLNVSEKLDPCFDPSPRYWVPMSEVVDRLESKNWDRKWLLGWRDFVGSEGRTLIPCICPRYGVGDNFLLLLPSVETKLIAALYACLASIPCDYLAKQKVGGSHLRNFVLKQVPVIPPKMFSEADLELISTRVAELTYTSHSLAPFAEDLGFSGPPYRWDEDRRAILRAELDAFYARMYGLSRDELRYILDPAEVMGEDYPSETFRVLKNNEMKKYGEYRTRRLVLEAWDRLEAGDLK